MCLAVSIYIGSCLGVSIFLKVRVSKSRFVRLSVFIMTSSRHLNIEFPCSKLQIFEKKLILKCYKTYRNVRFGARKTLSCFAVGYHKTVYYNQIFSSSREGASLKKLVKRLYKLILALKSERLALALETSLVLALKSKNVSGSHGKCLAVS